MAEAAGGCETMQLLGDAAIAIPMPGQAGCPATTAAVRAVANAITSAGLEDLVDVIPSPDRVTVCYDLSAADRLADLQASLAMIVRRASAAATGPPTSLHEVPVQYGGDAGPDLEDACRACGLDRKTLIRRHTEPDYLVTAVGFTPGFAYLGGLDSSLAMPRRATPRTRVPAGSVGIGGPQTGVYPCPSPGGWQIIGHTGVRFFDPTARQPALCGVGDTVRFVEADAPDLRSARESAAAAAADSAGNHSPNSGNGITVLSPGLLTSVQDLGRPGYRASGVTVGGAADPAAAAVANLLVGNPVDAALLEITLAGPTLRFEAASRIALTGASFPGVAGWRPLEVKAGSTIECGHATHGCRGYLAIAGGLQVPPLLGSRSTHLAAGFGGYRGRALKPGDRLCFGEAHHPATDSRWSLSPSLLSLPQQPARLRLMLPDDPPDAAPAFLGSAYRVTSQSNRMGLRLAGPPITQHGDGISRAVLPGTVQLPPDGQPILLLADSQTIGGYPVLGHVASADLRLAAQLRPGDELIFEPALRCEAHAAWHHQQDLLADIADRIAARWQPRLL
jgi:antagonist of KipI